MNGNLLSVEKLAEKKQEQVDSGGLFSHGHRKIKNYPSIIIEAVNQTGDTLDEFTCLRIIGGATPDDMSDAVYPEDTDDTEDSLYGSLVEDEIMPGQVCHVQIFGEALFLLKSGMSAPFITGEIAYPLPNGAGTKGRISNKATDPNTIISNPLGRTLNDDGADSTLVKVNLTNSGGGSSGNDPRLEFANLVSTVNIASLTGNPSIDGFTAADDYIVLLMAQSTTSQNGTYQLPTGGGAWTKIGQPKLVEILKGTSNSRCRYLLTSVNTYEGGIDFYG